jgi:Ca2+-binding EF-hand superfamily protein
VDASELKTFFNENKNDQIEKFSEKQHRAIFAYVDENGDGKISLEEFKEFVINADQK